MEGKTFQEETFQEERMNTSSEEALMQKLLKRVEAQGEVLENVISHLSKIEEDELKEGEKWDEGDKADYERSKLTQEDINRMMIEGKVCLLLPEFMSQLKSTPRARTFKRAHVNDFFESGDVGSWEDHG